MIVAGDEDKTKKIKKEVKEDSGEEDDEDWGEDWGGIKTKRVRRKKSHKPIKCNDGFVMSVQVSREHFCSPRDDVGPYDGVEAGYPNEWEDLLLPYIDNNTDPTPVVCDTAPTLYERSRMSRWK